MTTYGDVPTHVQTGEMDVEARYAEHIAELDRYTPTPADAARHLAKFAIMPSDYDEVVQNGISHNVDHERRALIEVARGDPRLFGQIYHVIRMLGREEPAPTYADASKAGGVAKRHSPFREKSPFF